MLTALSAILQAISCKLLSISKEGTSMLAEIGNAAPNFALRSSDNESVTLNQYRGDKHVVLSFHVFGFTGG